MPPNAVSTETPTSSRPAALRPELLSPAGEWEALKAAVANGADAVYFGLSDFNARHRATNFTVEELPQVMRYLHDHNVRGYVTCNTLIFSDELPQIVEYVKSLALSGVDAVIVQDLGLARLIRRLAPQLVVHGSTQMTLTDVRGVEFVKRMGVERVILARELSVKEIGQIAEGTTLPLEVFIHGALCVAYSGQCLTSESLGGRSANRGQCAQACRLPYDLIVDGEYRELGELAYLLSPQDLAAPDLIDDLVQAGVACFKIEGRLKSAQYVAATTQTYRTALDAALESQPFELTYEQSLSLQQSFSRGFSHGFLSGVDHQELVQGRFPKSRGVQLGRVVAKTSQGVIIELHEQHLLDDDRGIGNEGKSSVEQAPSPPAPLPRVRGRGEPRTGASITSVANAASVDADAGSIRHVATVIDVPVSSGFGSPLGLASADDALGSAEALPSRPVKPGDGIVFDEGHPDQDERGGRVVEVREAESRGRVPCVELMFHAGTINLASLALGCLVWKTDDPALRRRLEQTYNRDGVRHRVRVDARVHAAVGEPLTVEFRDAQGAIGTAVSEQLLEVAIRQPLRYATLREQLARLGDTPFELGDVILETTTGVVAEETPLPVMVPKSMLNDLRRQAVQNLRDARLQAERRDQLCLTALDELRAESVSSARENQPGQDTSQMTVLVRSLDQLRAVLDWRPEPGCPPVSLVYCDFEEVRRYEAAVKMARAAGVPSALATLRIVKPSEDGWLRQIGNFSPDYVLVRNLSALSFYQQEFPALPLLGDYSLNVSNELTAGIFTQQGIERLVPSYDLNWQQLQSLLERFPAGRFESVIHQHMPMFHMEHCVFAHALSDGKDYRDCGRPCDNHRVDLRDRVGEAHPLVADVGCRNTLFNAHAQSAAEYIPRMQQLGLRWFRIELLRETAADAAGLLTRYAQVLAGQAPGRAMWQQLRVLSQLGVTRGPLDFE